VKLANFAEYFSITRGKNNHFRLKSGVGASHGEGEGIILYYISPARTFGTDLYMPYIYTAYIYLKLIHFILNIYIFNTLIILILVY
jgi:hypothetical protein